MESGKESMEGYKSLKVWQCGIELALLCYKVTSKFPQKEIYGLVSQIIRSAASIPANIAEGYGRNTNKELIQFLYISLGSCNELDTHLIIARKLNYLSIEEFEQVNDLRTKTARMLAALIKSRKNL